MTAGDLFVRLGYNVDKNSEKKVNNSIQSLKSFAVKTLGAIGIGFSIKGFIETADQMSSLQARINNVNDGLLTTDELMRKIEKTASAAGGSFQNTAELIAKLGANAGDAFSNTDEILQFADQLNKNLLISGTSASEAAGAITQLTQGLASGTLRGDELNSVLENMPSVAGLIAKEFGVSRGELRKVASEGKITADVVKNALLNAANETNVAFAQMPMGVGQAMAYAKNKFQLLTGELNKQLGITEKLGKIIKKTVDKAINGVNRLRAFLQRLSKQLGGVRNLVKLLVASAGGLFLAFNSAKIISFFKVFTGLINLANVKSLFLAGIFALLFLAVDDFIVFMQGGKSVIGTVLEKWGIDTDKVREKVRLLWQKFKDALPTLSEIKTAFFKFAKKAIEYITPIATAMFELAKVIFPAVKDAIDKISPQVLETLKTLGETFVKDILPLLADALVEILPLLTEMFTTLLPIAVNIAGVLTEVIILLAKNMDWLQYVILAGVGIWGAYKAVIGTISFVKLIAGIITTAGAFIKKTSAIITNKLATISMIAILQGQLVKAFIVEKAALVASTAASVAQKVATVAMSVATKAAAAGQWLLNAAMSANPIGIIIMAVIALIAIFVALWKNNEAFRNFFINLWNGIKDFFSGIWDGIKTFFSGIWDAITEKVKSVGETLKAVFSAVGDFFKNIWTGIKDFFGGIWDGIAGFVDGFKTKFESIFTGIKDFFTNTFSTLGDILKAPINLAIKAANTIINGINKLSFDVPNWVPVIGGKKFGFDIPTIPELAKGSDNAPDTFIAGEKGAELITGARGAKVYTNSQTKDIFGMLNAMLQGGMPSTKATANNVSNSTSDTTINQNVNINNTFNGDRAGQEKSSYAMEKSTSDITANLTRALAFGV